MLRPAVIFIISNCPPKNVLTGQYLTNKIINWYVFSKFPEKQSKSGLLYTYVSIPGRGSKLPLEWLQSTRSNRWFRCARKMDLFEGKHLVKCYLNIEIFLLEIDIVMSFILNVILCKSWEKYSQFNHGKMEKYICDALQKNTKYIFKFAIIISNFLFCVFCDITIN